MYIKIILLSIILLAIAIAAIAIKMFVKKDGEFKKQCSSVDPDTGKKLGCTCEGAPGDGSCKTKDDSKVSPVVAQFEQLSVD